MMTSVALLEHAAISKADDLLDIVGARPCSSIQGDRVAATGNCKALAQPKGLAVVLQAEAGTAQFRFPSHVTFPGSTAAAITVDGLMLYNGSLTPEVWRLDTGDVLTVKLINRLPAGERAATNLHTHGMLVSPDLDVTEDGRAAEPVGDTVYVCTVPAPETPDSASAQHCKEHGALYGKSFSEMNYELALRRDHPDGLFWYHPHVHMNARSQVGAGMSGLIYVNGPDAAISGGARLAINHEPPFERFLMLKDIQIGEIDSSDPNGVKARYLPVEAHDAGLCGDRAPDAAPPLAVCFGKDDAGKDLGWLFTVNGQLFPHIDVAARRQEAWRIANTSADMTYDLALVETGTGRPLRLQILARDGVAAATEGGAALLAERVLLMPGSRIEVGVSRDTAEGLVDDSHPLNARLRSYGFFTGHDAGFGDAWPAVDLAEVVFQQAAPAAAAAANVPTAGRGAQRMAMRQLNTTSAPAPLVVSAWKPDLAGAKAVAPARAALTDVTPASHDHAMPNHEATLKATSETATAAAIGRCKPLEAGEDRIVALTIDKSSDEKFKIGTDRAHRDNAKDWNAAIDRAVKNSVQFGDPHAAVLCAHAGHSETWTIVNRRATTDGTPDGPADPNGNDETHNFHIHQLKFEVLDVVDPTGRVTRPLGGPSAKRKVDSFPVPIGGSLRIRIDFTRQQVGGRFVFHCHILEHEDKGMMAEIEVKDR
jgi:FtsP/CotA-like multicopper oxidase with cupredoxin domain